jgi:hypothetical protein
MTAGRKAMQARIAAQKLKEQRQQLQRKKSAAAQRANGSQGGRFTSASQSAETGEPPLSTSRTVVWYWSLNGIETTVMYSKDTCEVWCNGYVLESMETLGDGVEFSAVVNFGIYVDQLETIHDGKICRLMTGCDEDGDAVYELYVDGYLIPEHTSPGLSAVVNPGADNVASSFLPLDFMTDLPPRYEDVCGGHQSSAFVAEHKKTK